MKNTDCKRVVQNLFSNIQSTQSTSQPSVPEDVANDLRLWYTNSDGSRFSFRLKDVIDFHTEQLECLFAEDNRSIYSLIKWLALSQVFLAIGLICLVFYIY